MAEDVNKERVTTLGPSQTNTPETSPMQIRDILARTKLGGSELSSEAGQTLDPGQDADHPASTDREDVPPVDPLQTHFSTPAELGEQRHVLIEGAHHWYMKVFDPAEAVRVYAQRHGEAPDPPGSSLFGNEAHGGDHLLRAMAHDPAHGWRRLPVATRETIEALESLRCTMPNFAEPLELIRLACRASQVTGLPWRLPVLILDGPPGTGKTRFAKAISAILRTSVTEIAMPQLNGAGPLSGTDQTWKHPRVGKVAQVLISGETAAPCMLLDELEKAFSYAGDEPLDVLHHLWEGENARRFQDECLGCQFAAHRVIWIATSNETHGIRESLLDRAEVFTIAPPDRTQVEAVIHAIYADLCREWQGWFTADIDPAVINRVAAGSPRQIKATLHDAMVRAAADGRHILQIGNCGSYRDRQGRSQIGFIRHR